MRKSIFLCLLSFWVGLAFAEENHHFLDFSTEDFKVSSFMTEGDVKYSSKCLSSADTLPWVPKKPENASILIKNCDVKDIVISSGFVKKDRPDLYEKKSRPKTVKIEYQKSKKSKIVELKDTKEPQLINIFSANEISEPVKLIFLENYEGSKYKDLCVNYICKSVKKRNPTTSISSRTKHSFQTERMRENEVFIENFYSKNLKVLCGDDEFFVYNNNDFPEVRVNGFLVDFDISLSYVEVVSIKKTSEDSYEIVFSSDCGFEYFAFDKKTFLSERKMIRDFPGKDS